jgi:hypothetical protein
VELIPYRVLLPPGHPTLRSDRLLWSFSSLQRRSSDEPRHELVCQLQLWFRSQALSTSQRFPSKSESRGLVSCRCRSWDSTLQSLPLAEIACLSRGSLASLQLSTGLERDRTRDLVTPRFADSHALAQLPGSPDSYGLSFSSTSEDPVRPGARALELTSLPQLHLLRSFTPSCESVHSRLGSPQADRSILSWASAPLEPSPPTPRILYPSEPRLGHPLVARKLGADPTQDRDPVR